MEGRGEEQGGPARWRRVCRGVIHRVLTKQQIVDNRRLLGMNKHSYEEIVCVCAEIWHGDGLPVLCHALSNQPTTWGRNEGMREIWKRKINRNAGIWRGSEDKMHIME